MALCTDGLGFAAEMAATTLAEIDPTPKDIEWVTRELSKLCDFASDDMAKVC